MKRLFTFLLIFAALFNLPASAKKDIKVILDNKTLTFDQNPIIENNRTLVPVRKIFEELGAEVYWNENNRSITSYKGSDTISLKINSNIMVQNGKTVYLDVSPKIMNNRTLVPLRAISESFGAEVEWLEESYTVMISTQATNGTPENSTSEFEKQVFNLVNEERSKNGLSPLTWNNSVADVARAHSKDMGERNFMSHTNPDGLSPFDRLKNAGISYTMAAENIAAGQSTPQQVMQSWMNSDGHRKNILNPNLTQIGIGYYNSGSSYKHYWTQCFITK